MSAAVSADTFEPAAPQWQIEAVARGIDRLRAAARRNDIAPGMAARHRNALICALRELCALHSLTVPADVAEPVQVTTLQQQLEALRAARMATQKDIDKCKDRTRRHYMERDRWGIDSAVRVLRAQQGGQPC